MKKLIIPLLVGTLFGRCRSRQAGSLDDHETGGINPQSFVEPELVKWTSFDGLEISGWLYMPPAEKFPGKRPVLVLIHGGPEGQARPTYQSRFNYFLNEMGIAIITPNVRGSTGYGKNYVALDNGFKREGSSTPAFVHPPWGEKLTGSSCGNHRFAQGRPRLTQRAGRRWFSCRHIKGKPGRPANVLGTAYPLDLRTGVWQL